MFEDSLVEFSEYFPNRWEKIAANVGTKTAAEVQRHYALLLEDVASIQAGSIEPPGYEEFRSSEPSIIRATDHQSNQKPLNRRRIQRWCRENLPNRGQNMNTGFKLFLLGLEKYGKGDWKSIARYIVVARTPTQVASHAQKHFERQEKDDQRKKRKSIFDNSIDESSAMDFISS